MTASALNIPDEVAFHFVVKKQSLDTLINSLYNNPSELTKQHFLAVNSHLQQQVHPGQMVIITPPNSQQCMAYEAALSQAAQHIDKMLQAQSEEEARIMSEYYDLLAYAADKSGIGYGVAVNYLKHHHKQIESILKQIEKLYVDQYNKQGKFNSNVFLQQRRRLFQQMDSVLKTMIGRARFGIDFERGNLKRSLNLSTKSLIHQLKDHSGIVNDLPGFKENHYKIMKSSKFFKGAWYVGIGLDGVQSAATIRNACKYGTDQECTKSWYSQGGRLTGSIAGGVYGGNLGVAVGYGLCNLIFGIETLGSSLLWCGVVVGGAGGYLGSKYGGEMTQFGGEVIYETIY